MGHPVMDKNDLGVNATSDHYYERGEQMLLAQGQHRRCVGGDGGVTRGVGASSVGRGGCLWGGWGGVQVMFLRV